MPCPDWTAARQKCGAADPHPSMKPLMDKTGESKESDCEKFCRGAKLATNELCLWCEVELVPNTHIAAFDL